MLFLPFNKGCGEWQVGNVDAVFELCFETVCEVLCIPQYTD